jgi:hypothetical protein
MEPVEELEQNLEMAQDTWEFFRCFMMWINKHLGLSNLVLWIEKCFEQNTHPTLYTAYNCRYCVDRVGAIVAHILPRINNKGLLLCKSQRVEEILPEELKLQLAGNDIIAVRSEYTHGCMEATMCVVAFRPGRYPFSVSELMLLKSASRLLGQILEAKLRDDLYWDKLLDDMRDHYDTSSDWWSKGEPPPF